ncbi:BTAD domain-containing putative transcriptional regulator [Candidatus Accumulibacter sp. ACC003]|jgi:DNA-binding SARP family transcriptional activator|uniref:BTAD domain-containing putative transcriptional regulator n=1 Tax=Candidatus Accumulibacter sp. ACC003 TaxID=2823334 RepID=UPI0025C5129E|nr:BTAD domain-containing putative transcriptional regulator [Candidatus Accumulibacter sp. ACC003]
MPQFRLTLLGRFRLDDENGREVAVASRKTQAMLAVLAVHSPAAVTRERIAGLLWGDLADERARHSLRQVLTALRREAAIVEASSETLCLDSDACTSDVSEFAALAANTEAAELARALTLHGGDFLDGLASKEEAFAEWLSAERTRLAKAAVTIMLQLAAFHAGRAEHQAAVQLLQLILAGDALNEGAHRALMRSLDTLGRRSDALQQYQLCRELLLKELQVEPDAATRALHDSLRAASGTPRRSEGGGRPVVAVVPFANVARAPEIDSLATSIADEISRQLAHAPGFRVVVQPAVLAAMQPNPDDLRQLARVLGATYLVTGSLRQPESGCLRIALQIVDGEKAQYLWSLQQDLLRGGKAAVDDFVAGSAARIEQQLSVAEATAGDAHDDRHDAWHKTHQAASALFSAGWSETAVATAVQRYREAIALDPDLALAYAHKAMIIAFAQDWGLLHRDPARDEARADAEKALELAPSRSEVLGMAACAIAHLGDPARAVPLLERAIEENPNNAQAWAALGATRLLQMQFAAAVEALRRGLRTSPTDYRRSVWLTALASGLVRLNRLDEALDAAQGACRSDAKFYPARIVLAMVLAKLERDGEARKALADATRLRPQLTLAEMRRFVGSALDRLGASAGF